LPQDKFWGVRDFKYLFRSKNVTINSSVMWFNTKKYSYIYSEFEPKLIRKSIGGFHGDQDYIHSKIPVHDLKFFNTDYVQSYKWQVKEGGYDFSKRKHLQPGTITWPLATTSILIFHGSPNPHEEIHPIVQDNWV